MALPVTPDSSRVHPRSYLKLKTTFQANLRNSGAGQLLQPLDKLEGVTGDLSSIREVLKSS